MTYGPIPTRFPVTLANGQNDDVDIGLSVDPGVSDEFGAFIGITGPTDVFSISGFTAGADGRRVVVCSEVPFAMTLNNLTSSADANQIITGNGADVAEDPFAGATLELIYNAALAKWCLLRGCTKVPPPPSHMFIDDLGNTYDDTTGALTGSGGTPHADIDPAFGYSQTDDGSGGFNCFTGVTAAYNTLQIGRANLTPNFNGYQGEVYSANNTVLVEGLGASTGILLGMETLNTSDGSHSNDWVVRLRDAITFAVLATDAGAYITAWVAAHPGTFFDGIPTNYGVNVSPDPVDGSFWINMGCVPPDPIPMFNVSATDGSLIRTVSIAAPTQFVLRVHRV
jgi:hypothetical protein